MRRLARYGSVGIALLAFAGCTVGCANPAPVVVTYDERDALESGRTWDWIDGDAVQVHGALGDAMQLDADLSALVATELIQRGLVRTPERADLRVAALLVVSRTYQTTRRAGAIQTLHSYHDLGNYEIQTDEMVRLPLDRIRLAVFVTGGRQERMIWRAQLEERYPGGLSRHLDEAVARLFGEFPNSHAIPGPIAD